MKSPVEARCIVCSKNFCCADCRWNHEQTVHGLKFDCILCREFKYLCKPEDLTNIDFLKHIETEHLPLHCSKCGDIYNTMEDLKNIDKCTSLTELIEKERDPNETEARFDSIYVKSKEYESVIGPSGKTVKINKTAVITPIMRKKYLVDYDLSDNDSDYDSPKFQETPLPLAPKTPKIHKLRTATPHVKKIMTIMRQKIIEEFDNEENEDVNVETSKTTPVRTENAEEAKQEMTTPTPAANDRCLKLAQIVTTSTPTHPLNNGWSMFPEQSQESPLSEIEGTRGDSTANSLDHEPSKSETSEIAPKLKSIIVTGSKLRLGSQDSSEKGTFDSTNNTDSARAKRVKFAEDTVFEQDKKANRIFRKPKRMLTPGPQKPRRCLMNPRFQALINRFESQGNTLARTPITGREIDPETPPVGDHTNIQARAINFKDDSPVLVVEHEKDSFKSCIGSPIENTKTLVKAGISELATNVAGSLENCLTSAFNETDVETEIQFKLVIVKRRAGIVESKTEKEQTDKENIWSTVAKAVKSIFSKDDSKSESTTPLTRTHWSDPTSSASKRKCSEIDSNLSPLNHKRHKYSGRIRGRPPLRSNIGVSSLRSSLSAEQESLLHEINQDEINQSF